MVTRTGRFSGVLAATALAGAELVDLPQQLLDAAAHRLAFGVQRLQLAGEPRSFRARFGGFLHGRVFLLPQPRHQLHRLLDALLERMERIGFLFHGTHPATGSKAALAFSTSKLKFAGSPPNSAASAGRRMTCNGSWMQNRSRRRNWKSPACVATSGPRRK